MISGTAKGHPLKSVSGQGTRPTTDKIKESLFQKIGPYFDGGTALDLFAGSGGLGIEALSRGVEHCVFVDKDPLAIKTIHANVTKCKFETRAEIYRNEALRSLSVAAKNGTRFVLIFLDPPYHLSILPKALKKIDQEQLLDQGGLIVTEHDTDVSMPDKFDTFALWKREEYSRQTTMTLYRSTR
ncbi:16S rRNA (guanine(966)-N(2))-methyltransferase RsmD [Aureibacillus halotolerans]|uniref:16S rRNA (Guanine(966)-N(2))-methyltransferase RsmD n=1 Tax=Aureibacillus halotolerans TaxID=1508390 RepID=A0A4R6UC28_9BACI|nr:16S rRNA (guanine(966)-N(2))-methyltransferase RsmD [Aureibacillus halotolerans]